MAYTAPDISALELVVWPGSEDPDITDLRFHLADSPGYYGDYNPTQVEISGDATFISPYAREADGDYNVPKATISGTGTTPIWCNGNYNVKQVVISGYTVAQGQYNPPQVEINGDATVPYFCNGRYTGTKATINGSAVQTIVGEGDYQPEQVQISGVAIYTRPADGRYSVQKATINGSAAMTIECAGNYRPAHVRINGFSLISDNDTALTFSDGDGAPGSTPYVLDEIIWQFDQTTYCRGNYSVPMVEINGDAS